MGRDRAGFVTDPSRFERCCPRHGTPLRDLRCPTCRRPLGLWLVVELRTARAVAVATPHSVCLADDWHPAVDGSDARQPAYSASGRRPAA